MAVPEPMEAHPPELGIHDTEAMRRPPILIGARDLGRVRLYARLAAAIPAVLVVLLAVLVAWISIGIFDGSWRSAPVLVPLSIAVLGAAAYYLRAELRLRSYELDITPDAVVFEYGRKRSYVPLEHIQLFDTESTILLRRFRLSRCILHTGGGMVVVSPVPTPIAAAIEQAVDEELAATHAEQTHAAR